MVKAPFCTKMLISLSEKFSDVIRLHKLKW
uniref:Uncharacterized protein n=1 Tax=Schistosoma japonicum TaxID=6182 RepID=Q5C7Z0_SCHJA|nr:unknown [Schistosoma japonicum]